MEVNDNRCSILSEASTFNLTTFINKLEILRRVQNQKIVQKRIARVLKYMKG
jgi:hypothetical protein